MDGNSGNHGPPKGPPPEYSKKMHEQSVRCQNTVVAVACLFVFLNILFVILRVIARRIVKKTPWFWDDYTVFLGLLFNLAIQIVAIGEQSPATRKQRRARSNVNPTKSRQRQLE